MCFSGKFGSFVLGVLLASGLSAASSEARAGSVTEAPGGGTITCKTGLRKNEGLIVNFSGGEVSALTASFNVLATADDAVLSALRPVFGFEHDEAVDLSVQVPQAKCDQFAGDPRLIRCDLFTPTIKLQSHDGRTAGKVAEIGALVSERTTTENWGGVIRSKLTYRLEFIIDGKNYEFPADFPETDPTKCAFQAVASN
jgi:hypothetical protein